MERRGDRRRLWQGASQVEAPVLQFEQKDKRLVAGATGQGVAMPVHTVLVNGGAAKAGSAKPGVEQGKTQVVRVASHELTYSDATRQAEFTGGVQVESADGRMNGQEAVVYLQTAQKAGAANASASEDGLRRAAGWIYGGQRRADCGDREY